MSSPNTSPSKGMGMSPSRPVTPSQWLVLNQQTFLNNQQAHHPFSRPGIPVSRPTTPLSRTASALSLNRSDAPSPSPHHHNNNHNQSLRPSSALSSYSQTQTASSTPKTPKAPASPAPAPQPLRRRRRKSSAAMIVCPCCHKRQRDYRLLESHLRYTHHKTEDMVAKLLELWETPFACEVCPQFFVNREDQKRHFMESHGEDVERLVLWSLENGGQTEKWIL